MDIDIISAMRDPEVFGSLFKDIETWRSWAVYLAALFGEEISSKADRKLLKSCTGLKHTPDKRVTESFVICGRRSGKSFISAIVAVYLAALKDWRPFLGPGERGYIFIVANDKAQARIVKEYISGILKGGACFRGKVSKDLAFEVELNNQVTIAVKSGSFRALRGYTLVAAILEEIAFWRSDESANPDREVLAAVRPALATIPESLLIGISTPYSRAGVLYEQYKRHYGKSGGPLIWKAPTALMNPTIDKGRIRQAMRDDPASAKNEWAAEFRADIAAFMPLEFIEAVVVPGRFELPKIAGAKYFGFADPSGGRQDSFTLSIAHKEKSGKIVLDVLRETRPPFQPSQVVAEYAETLKTYGITQVESDRYAAEWVTEAFRKCGIRVKNSERTASEIYMAFLPLVANGTVELLDSPRLKAQLAGLERRTRSGGKDSVSHYPGTHDDLANAAAGVCAMLAAGPGIVVRATRFPKYSTPGRSELEKLLDDEEREIRKMSGEELDREIELAEKEIRE